MPFQQNEQIYSILMDATPDCVKVLDLEGKILHINTPGLCAMEVDNFSRVFQQQWWTLWPEEAHLDIKQSIARAVKGEACSFEAYCPTAKGTPKWWDVSVSPVRDAVSGQVGQLVSVSRDITRRKDTEKALKLSESRLATLHSVTSSPSLSDADRLARLLRLGIDEFNLETGVIAQISDGVYRVVLADTPDGSVSTGFRCDAKDMICAETLRRNSLLEIESLAQSDWHTHPACNKFGTEVYFGLPLAVQGQIFGTLCYVSQRAHAQKFSTSDHEFLRLLAQTIGTEITRQQSADKLQAAEAEFRAIFELSAVGKAQISAETLRFIRVNAKFCEMIGYTAEELATLTPGDITFAQDLDAVFEAMGPVLRGEIAVYDLESRFVRKDGMIIWVHVNATLLHDADGRPQRTMAVVQDITQRKLAEDALHESQKRFQLAIRAGGLGIWETDRELGQRGWSPEAMAIFDLDLPEGIGCFGGEQDELRSRLHPEDRHLHDQYHRELQETGSIKVEYRIVLPNGDIRWVSGGASVLTRNADGIPVRSVHIAADTTAQVQAAEKLRQSATRYRTLFESMDQGYCVIEIIFDGHDSAVDYRFLEVNPAFERHTGLADATGQTIRALVPEIEPRWAEMYGKVARTGTPLRFVDKASAMQGRWFDVFAFRLGDQGSNKVAILFSDVSDRIRADAALRESDERMRAATDAISDVIWTNNAQGHMAGEQPGWQAFTGQTRQACQGYGWSNAIHPEDAQPTVDAWNSAVAEKRKFFFEHRVRRHDGQWRLCAVCAVPLFNPEGGIREWVGVHTDITVKKQDEEKLRKLASELSEANLRKDEFLATLAHELRNPLAPIRNGLQLMKLSGGEQKSMEQARAMMERQLAQMVRLIDDLMDASRINQGKLELRKELVALQTIVCSAVETSRPLIDEMGHKLTVSMPELPVMVHADTTRLAQVFMNLLNNAAKYSEQGGHIDVRVEQSHDIAVVTVKDTGIGIDPDQLPRIFRMFAQVDKSLEKSHGGLGIGLSLVKRLVEMHGGAVEAASDGLGTGSVFLVRLPLTTPITTYRVDMKLSSEEDKPVASKPPLRILVVDDNRDAADSLAEMLELMGNDTRAAYDGQQGVDMASEFRPEVILFDIGMPKLNGYEACRLVRQQPWGRDIVLIAATGWGQEKDRSRTHEAGFDHHLVKPVDPQELIKTLSDLTDRKLSA